MHPSVRPWLALWLALPFFPLSSVHAQTAGSIVTVGQTKVSAMMMMLGNEEKVYILDKVENNPTTINGHPAWAVSWDIASSQATPMDMSTNTFCAAGMHAPNGSFWTFGGNGAIGPGGNIGSVKNPDNVSGAFDATYQDLDGAKSIRVINPCTDESCQWFDNASQLFMAKKRWYPGCEPLADGSVVLIGGFVNGGYVNRNFPNTDPTTEGGAAEPSFEFFPPRGDPVNMQFMTTTSGLNAYSHTFLMPSGKMFVQANISTILWDYDANVETPLPNMPNGVARVYPASGGVAMLPLTPANNYTPTIIFCGGSAMDANDYGNYANPVADTWTIPASPDCQRITPEPTDGSAPAYFQDDNMIQGRTMGQFIILPDQTLLMINGGGNGTAGYATNTGHTAQAQMPFTMSLASDPVLKPAIYNPSLPAGSRWSDGGLQSSSIPRLYHSSAILLPDASVLVAGSNPNVDYNANAFFPTEYRAERFYPWYFSASTRPAPQGIPTSLTYGGDYFNVTVPSSGFTGSANDAAKNTTVVIIRPGFTTHAMNMGQRLMQLNNTYNVGDDGTITLHVSQPVPNPNLVTPGPVLFFVVVNGVPSTGKMIILGSGNIEQQQTLNVGDLPQSHLSASKSASGSGTKSGGHSGPSTGVVIAAAAGGVALLAAVAAFTCVLVARRRRARQTRSTIIGGVVRSTSMGRGYRDKPEGGAAASAAAGGFGYQYGGHDRGSTGSSDTFIPLQQYSTADLHASPSHKLGGGEASWNPSAVSLQDSPGPGYQHPHPQQGQGGYGAYPNDSTPSFNPYASEARYGPGPR